MDREASAMCVAVVLAEDGGCVKVATKVVQGKVEEGARKVASTLPTNWRGRQEGGLWATRRARCDRSNRRQSVRERRYPGDTLGGLTCESSTFGNIVLKSSTFGKWPHTHTGAGTGVLQDNLCATDGALSPVVPCPSPYLRRIF